MSAIAEKQVMFVYNRNEKDADVEFDPNGDFPCPINGSTLDRRGKKWTVVGTPVFNLQRQGQRRCRS